MTAWWQVTVHTRFEAVEAIAHWLYERGVGGVHIEVHEDASCGVHAHGQWADAPLSDVAKGDARVHAYVPGHTAIDAYVAELHAFVYCCAEFGLDIGTVAVTSSLIDEEDWAQSWKAHIQPMCVGMSLRIQPTWIPLAETTRHVVWIDPGMAFGTGHHVSTVHCLEAIERIGCAGRTVVDVGTGSGILAIAAARLGAAHVWALDIDALAVRVALDNVAVNAVADTVTVLHSDMLHALPDVLVPDLIVSNILAQWLAPLADVVAQRLPIGAFWVTSGVVDTHEHLVTQACAQSFAIVHRAHEDGWVTHTWRRRG
jgi:ribosomal protein L11 methyltransferase